MKLFTLALISAVTFAQEQEFSTTDMDMDNMDHDMSHTDDDRPRMFELECTATGETVKGRTIDEIVDNYKGKIKQRYQKFRKNMKEREESKENSNKGSMYNFQKHVERRWNKKDDERDMKDEDWDRDDMKDRMDERDWDKDDMKDRMDERDWDKDDMKDRMDDSDSDDDQDKRKRDFKERLRENAIEKWQQRKRQAKIQKRQEQFKKNMKKTIKKRRQESDIQLCNPESMQGWRTYYNLKGLTLLSEQCSDTSDLQCFSGAIFEWVCPSGADRFKCAVGYAPKNEDDYVDGQFEKVSFEEDDQRISSIDYLESLEDGVDGFSYLSLSTQDYSIQVGARDTRVVSSLSDFSTTSPVIGLFVDINTSNEIISDFGAYTQDAENCNCDDSTSIVETNYRKKMIAIERDAKQKINVKTNVGPQKVWNYCGAPEILPEQGQTSFPDWLEVDFNKLTVPMDESNTGIFKINGEMQIGNSILEQGELIAYVGMLADCDSEELADGYQSFQDFSDWLANDKEIYGPWDVEARHPRAQVIDWFKHWWNREEENVNIIVAAMKKCDEFNEGFKSAVDSWMDQK